MFDALLVR